MVAPNPPYLLVVSSSTPSKVLGSLTLQILAWRVPAGLSLDALSLLHFQGQGRKAEKPIEQLRKLNEVGWRRPHMPVIYVCPRRLRQHSFGDSGEQSHEEEVDF